MNADDRMSQIRYQEQNREALANGSTEEERHELRRRRKIFSLKERELLALLRKHLVLPDDVTIEKIYLDEAWDEFKIVLQSKSFDKVPEGQIPPYILDGIALRL